MKHTGGIRIGWFHASWPFATLSCDAKEMNIKVLFSEEYRFSPNQVIGLEKVGSIPFLSQGVKIRHIVSEYPENIIFYWGGGDADKLIKDIHGLGFRPEATAAAAPVRDGIPVKWIVLVMLIAIWNVLFLVDRFRPSKINHNGLGLYSLLALVIVFGLSMATRFSKKVQTIILKPGRSVGEITHILSLFMLITAFMAIILGMILAAENF